MTFRPTRRASAAALTASLLGVLAKGAMAQGAGREPNPAPLQFGVMPNVSARVLVAQYQPFRTYLEEALSRSVEVVTAPGLQPFHQRTVAGAYGLVVTAANLGRVAQLDAGLRPIAIYEPRIPGLLVVHKDRPLLGLAALRGRQVAMTNPQSLVALKFVHFARAGGITIGTDAGAVHARNEDSLAQLLTGPETPLAVMSRGEFNAIRPEIRDTLDIWQQFITVPGFLVMLGASVRGAEEDRLRAVLARFPASEAGQRFFQATGFRGIRPVTETDLAELDDVVEETRILLRGG